MSFRSRHRWLHGILAASLLSAAMAYAQQSYFEKIDGGAPSAVGTQGLAQDAQGLIWLAHSDGLWRYDGRNFAHWQADRFSAPVHDIVQSRSHEIFLRTFDNRGYFKRERGLDPLLGPDGERVANLLHMAYDPHGRLWCVLGKALWRRDRDGRWTAIASARFGNETPQRLSALEDGIGLMTDAGAWLLRDAAPAQRLLAARGLWVMAGGGAHPVWISAHFCDNRFPRLWRYDGKTAQPVVCHGGRVMDMRYRHDTLWHATDTALNAYEPDGRVRSLTTARGLPSGGMLFVDQEQSLWMTSFAGLLHFPEPDTWHWAQTEGLAQPFGYWIEYASGRVWVSIWGGTLASLAEDGSDLRVVTEFKPYGKTCADTQGRLWASSKDQLWLYASGKFRVVRQAFGPTGSIQSCLRDGDVLWMPTTRGLYRVDANMAEPALVLAAPADEPFEAVWSGRANTLWLARHSQACEFGKNRDGSLTPLGCSAFPAIPADSGIGGVLPLAPDRVWIGCNTCAVGLDGHAARLLPPDNIATNAYFIAARSGGYWMTGTNQPLARIHPCANCGSGYELLEKPGKWQGIPPGINGYALETPRGDVWVNSSGVYRIPAAVRAGPQTPPNVVLVRVRVDGRDKPLDKPLRVGLDEHGIALEFAALTYRDRNLLRYRSRFAGEKDWHELDRSTGAMQFVDLPPGAYRVEVQASLDGERWSEPPSAAAFAVATPWYRTDGAFAAFALCGIVLLTLIYRARMASVLRVERERTRIAMDLHDDLGAGLGSIGMLAVVAARADIDATERQRVAAQIAQTAGLLGGGLRSLVWSMKSGRAGLADLATQLADHARRLLPGPEPRLLVDLPLRFPRGIVDPEVRRHVLLIALEALHNALRHARAQHVRVRLNAEAGRWLLAIEDDGGGFDLTQENCGSGLESMQRRSRLIGADWSCVSSAGAGVRIELRFVPFGTHRMFMRWRRRGTVGKVAQ